MKLVILTLFAVSLLTYSLGLFKPPVDDGLEKRIRIARTEVNNINFGGCGYNAWYVKQYLDKKGIKSNLIVVWKPFHIMNEVDGVYVDKNGFFSSAYLGWLNHDTITPDRLQQWLNDSSRWNKSFNRSDTSRLKQIYME